MNRIRLTEGSRFHKKGDSYLKERLVICNEEDTDGRAIRCGEEQVLHVD